MSNNHVDAALMRHGGLTYLEIPAIDPAKSALFYQHVLNWQIHGEDPLRPKFSDPDGHMIGKWVTGRSVAREVGMVAYMYVDDIHAAVERAAAHGGAVVKQVCPEGNLLVAVVRDPAGNVLGLWQAAHSGE